MERDGSVQDSGIAGKSVYFYSRRIVVMMQLNDLSTLLVLFVSDILSISL